MSIEYQIAEYLLKHGDVMLDEIRARAIPQEFPGEYYEQAVVEEVISELVDRLGLNYSDVAGVITNNYLTKLLGRE